MHRQELVCYFLIIYYPKLDKPEVTEVLEISIP